MTDAPQTPATPENPRPWYRNKWLWAFLAGALYLQLMRPMTRHVPEPPEVIGELPGWSLTDHNGEPFGLEDMKGEVWVAGFFFTSCVTVCPKLMGAMHKLQELYAKDDIPIRLLSITVDPDNDTPEALAKYAEGIGADLDRWTFITGDEKPVRELIVGGFKTYMGEKEELEDRPGVFDVGPGGRLMIVGEKGQLRGRAYEVLTLDEKSVWQHNEMGIDELFHRSQHVLRAAKEQTSTPFGCTSAVRFAP